MNTTKKGAKLTRLDSRGCLRIEIGTVKERTSLAYPTCERDALIMLLLKRKSIRVLWVKIGLDAKPVEFEHDTTRLVLTNLKHPFVEASMMTYFKVQMMPRVATLIIYCARICHNATLLRPVVVSILQEAMSGCPPSVTDMISRLLLKDAAYGAAAYIYYELLLQDRDLCVRLAASRSLYFHIEDATFSQQEFAYLLPVCWKLSFKLIEDVQEFDSKVQVLNTISVLISYVGDIISYALQLV
ncbi:hypothetical protein L2E82_22602 [Cichorium intybus]|uniref:Uncharacterized protein n=1 Tax=Cichorium intybus TaxID=13427 RepID=A0ACB9DXU3_CICIN|nr:hypothetical protein L2E82_22602 [Cichorium intybus]